MTRAFTLIRAIEATAWVAGTALLLTYAASQWRFRDAHDAGLRDFAAAVERVDARHPPQPAVAVDTPTLGNISAPDLTSWSHGRIAAFERNSGTSAPRAVLRIESVDLEVPVYEGVTESNLNRGAAWIEGTAPLGQPGNAGLAAHRDGYFRALRHIEIGDRIEVQTLARKTVYIVEQLLIVEPTDVQVLAPSNDDRLTLVTCYPFFNVGPAPKRFIVRAVAADPHMSAPAPG